MSTPSTALAAVDSTPLLLTTTSAPQPSVKDRCLKRYGFYDSRLILSENKESGKVTIKANAFNYRVILENTEGLDLRFSVFEQSELINGQPLTDIEIDEAWMKMIKFLDGARVARNDVQRALELVANANKYNPLKEWFEKLPPAEGNGYLNRWLFDVCGCPETEINRVLGRKWLISAVARALDPGCYVEGSLIFFGNQGIGKTWLFQNLNPKPEYYSGEALNIGNKKEAAAVCAGKYIIELGELNSIRRNELNDMKQYLTATSDTYQPKYKQKAVTVPRMHVFGGSTNEETFLTDPTGNRRFWCVAAGEKVDQVGFLAVKEQLWAEALAAYKAGEQWTLSDEERVMLEKANEQFKVEDPLKAFLEEALTDLWPDQFLTTNKLLQEVLKPYKDKVHDKALASAMQSLGWKKKDCTSGKNKGRKGYERPPSPPSEEEQAVW
jgi:putative DNA primase/helicase